MPLDFHRVMQDAPDADQIETGEAVEQQMTRSPDDAALMPRPTPAMAQMVAAHIRAEFETPDAAASLRLGGQFAQSNDKQALVSQPGQFPELHMRPFENLDDIGARRGRQAKLGHFLQALALRARTSASLPKPAI